MLLFTAAAWYVTQDLFRSAPVNVLLLTGAVAPGSAPALVDATTHQGRYFPFQRSLDNGNGSEIEIEAVLTGLHPLTATTGNDDQLDRDGRQSPLLQLARAGYLVEGIQDFMRSEPYRSLGLEITADTGDLLYRLSLHRYHQTPFFIWYHYDEQQPRECPEPTGGDTHFDHWFATFWDHFTSSGLQRNTILLLITDPLANVVTGNTLSRPELRPGLMIRLPDILSEEVLVNDTEHSSSPLDIMPTLFHLLGLSPLPEWQGRRLFVTAAEQRRSRP